MSNLDIAIERIKQLIVDLALDINNIILSYHRNLLYLLKRNKPVYKKAGT